MKGPLREMFPAGRPVVGKMLIGREHLLEELGDVLSIGQSVVLVAPRRYGKTSVALEALERFRKKGCFIADIDIFDVTDKRHLAEKFVESCLKNNPVPIEKYWRRLKKGALGVLSMLRFKPSDEDMEMVLQIEAPSADAERLLDDALDFPETFSRRHKRHLAMFIDEFQEITKIGGDALLKKMRAKFQRHRNVVYLFAGSQESLMTELFKSKRHAFYRFGRLFEVGPIGTEALAPYIERSFSSADIRIDPEETAAIIRATGGHPYYTQLLCQMIYIGCLQRKKHAVGATDVEAAEAAVIDHEQALFDEIWRELGDKRYSRNIVGLIARAASPYSSAGTTKENIARILSDLVRYGYVSKRGSGRQTHYDLKDAFFKRYVLSKVES